MDNSTWGDPWVESPSGSRAEDSWHYNDQYDYSNAAHAAYEFDDWANISEDHLAYVTDPVDVGIDEEEQSYNDSAFANTFGASDLAPGQLMSPKVPPAYDGNTSFFAYEELVYDWQDIIHWIKTNVVQHSGRAW